MLPLTRSRNRARFFGTPFSPASLFAGGTVAGAWYDPSDLSTMFTTSAGTTQCAMPGGGAAVSVGRILDKSGNGNHAIAANNTTARPELRARVNLLTYSEEFNNSYWIKRGINAFGSGSVANTTATLDPLGGNTADFIQESTANSVHGVDNNGITLPASTFVHSVYVKAATRTWAYVRLADAAGKGAYFNLSNGTIGTVEAGISAAIAAAGNGWYRCSVSITTTAGLWFPFTGAASGDNQGSYTGDGTSGIYIWGADLRPANIGAAVPAYQRIADAHTYDTSGFPLYLRFDGIDDLMYTPANLNLSGTDKVAVFAGVRIAAGTGSQNVCEFSNNAFTTNGGFSVAQGTNAASSGFGFLMNAGSGIAGQTANKSVPYSSAITETFDSAQSGLANEVKLRMDGVAQTFTSTSGTDSGSGNFGSHILNIACRGATVAPGVFLNGNIYSLIIAGSAVSAGNISATEQWVAGKTGITI